MLRSGAYDARSSAANPLARLPPEYPQSEIVALGEMPENADDQCGTDIVQHHMSGKIIGEKRGIWAQVIRCSHYPAFVQCGDDQDQLRLGHDQPQLIVGGRVKLEGVGRGAVRVGCVLCCLERKQLDVVCIVRNEDGRCSRNGLTKGVR